MAKDIWALRLKTWLGHLKRVKVGLDTPAELLTLLADRARYRLTGVDRKCYDKKMATRRLGRTKRADCYEIGGVRLPLLTDIDDAMSLGRYIFEDTFFVYEHCNDCYDENKIDEYFYMLNEGPYCLKNGLIDVTVQPNDVVIDAGSWVGDFAAYASVKGAKVYAFEPTDKIFKVLCRTAELNKNITPVKKGLSDRNSDATLSIQEGFSEGNSVVIDRSWGGGAS